ncbi:hypothetical protein ACGYLX_04900 [Sulfitobacter sp. 1A13496]|uniref:hypothetical protein n=1 Tax=Sulfitobacter sp. 1A13496 TaxID=3368596 RepID=UPI0037454CAF
MARPAIAARLKRLETRNRPPARVRSSVARFTPEGKLIGTMPKGPCMIVTEHGSDDEWQAALLAQQARLINEASETIAEEEGIRHNA